MRSKVAAVLWGGEHIHICHRWRKIANTDLELVRKIPARSWERLLFLVDKRVAIPVPIPIHQDARTSLATREIKGMLSGEVLNTINSPFLVSRSPYTHHILWERNKKQLSGDNQWVR